MKRTLTIAVVLAGLGLSAPPAGARETADFYRQNCFSCHTIGGGRLTGPDLQNVHQRQDREWLIRFLLDPKGVLDGGDPYALQMLEEARGVVMPAVAGINRDRAEALLDFITEESALPESRFRGLTIPDHPFTPTDVARGRALFVGHRRLAEGGPSCLSCHTVRDLGGLGGGRVGPDLTGVYERLEGRKGLAAWLSAPATTTMQPIYQSHPLKQEEVLALVAYLEDAARTGGEDTSAARLGFLLLGLGGCVAGLVSFDMIWRRRLHSVRRPLTESAQPKGLS